MAYRIRSGETVQAALHRVVDQQSGKALRDLAGTRESGVEEAIHDARKRCKKMRGALRWVRPAIGDVYKPANRHFRDAARVLGPYRDAHAVLETFDLLCAAAPGRALDQPPLKAVRNGLAADAESASNAVRDATGDLGEATHRIESGVACVRRARIDGSAWSRIGPGVKKTYRRGRKALTNAGKGRDPDDFHEWRKRCKYSWYHLRLLENSAPWRLEPLATGFHALSGTLGDAHDLHVLAERLQADPDRYGAAGAVEHVLPVADALRRRLEQHALRGGSILYAESPDAFVERLGRYWTTWRRHGPEPALPELEQLAE
jgi:CHAD domain-containing protein